MLCSFEAEVKCVMESYPYFTFYVLALQNLSQQRCGPPFLLKYTPILPAVSFYSSFGNEIVVIRCYLQKCPWSYMCAKADHMLIMTGEGKVCKR